MKRILTLSFISIFVLSVLSGCSSYTIERGEIEIKKQPTQYPHPPIKKEEEHEEDDDKEGPGNSDFGHSHMKPEIKKKFEENKEKNKDKFENKENKKENKKNKKERDDEED